MSASRSLKNSAGSLWGQSLLAFDHQAQAQAGAVEVHLHDDGRRVALLHGLAEGLGAVADQAGQAEEFQLAGQPLAALGVLQCQVDRLAQGRQGAGLEAVALAQAGVRQALHQAVQFAELQATGAAAVAAWIACRHWSMAAASSAWAGCSKRWAYWPRRWQACDQLGGVGRIPGAALQALPDFQNVAGLMHDALGEVLLQAVAVGVFVSGHDPASC